MLAFDVCQGLEQKPGNARGSLRTGNKAPSPPPLLTAGEKVQRASRNKRGMFFKVLQKKDLNFESDLAVGFGAGSIRIG